MKHDLHTNKGAAMMFGANSLADLIYDIEIAIRGCTDPDIAAFIRRHGQNLEKRFLDWMQNHFALFTELGVYSGRVFEVPEHKLEALRARFADNIAMSDALKTICGELLSTDFGDLLKEFKSHVNSVAERLGKSVEFQIDEPKGERILVDPAQYREVTRSFVHLFNNSIDHGFETPAEREAAGKSGKGLLKLSYGRANIAGVPMIRLLIEDDGKGIDIERVRAGQIKKGNAKAADMTDLDVAMTIFQSPSSTKESVSIISGQGVGVGAVQAAVDKAGGKIRILETGPRGTRFEILLPELGERKSSEANAA
jgi:chemotaxis protein histidine kinase CheA